MKIIYFYLKHLICIWNFTTNHWKKNCILSFSAHKLFIRRISDKSLCDCNIHNHILRRIEKNNEEKTTLKRFLLLNVEHKAFTTFSAFLARQSFRIKNFFVCEREWAKNRGNVEMVAPQICRYVANLSFYPKMYGWRVCVSHRLICLVVV